MSSPLGRIPELKSRGEVSSQQPPRLGKFPDMVPVQQRQCHITQKVEHSVSDCTLTNVSQQETTISKFINKSPVYICCQLQSIAWTEMSLTDRSPLPVRVTACVKCTNLVFPGRGLSLHVEHDQMCQTTRTDYPQMNAKSLLLYHNFRTRSPQKKHHIDAQNSTESLSSFSFRPCPQHACYPHDNGTWKVC